MTLAPTIPYAHHTVSMCVYLIVVSAHFRSYECVVRIYYSPEPRELRSAALRVIFTRRTRTRARIV